jgi:hypothetical protein
LSDIEYVANIAEIIGATVVVITLIYLTIQLRQNNKLLQSATRQAMLETEKTSLSQALEFQELFRKLNQSEKLSEEEQFQLSIIFITDMENRYFEYRQYKNGLLSEQEWQARLAIAVENHGIPRGHRWWSKVGRNLWPTEFVEFIDGVLRDQTPIDMYQQFSDWDEKG